MQPESSLMPSRASVSVVVRSNTQLTRGAVFAEVGSRDAVESGGGILYAAGSSVLILPGSKLSSGVATGSGGVILARGSVLSVAGATIESGVALDGRGGCIATADGDGATSVV